MNPNVTTANSSLSSYMDISPGVCFTPLYGLIFAVYLASLLINIFHLAILLHLESLRGTKYRYVLVNISLADIVHVLSIAFMYSCYDTNIVTLIAGKSSLKNPLAIMITIGNYTPYYVFLVASMEKYLAICKPYSYQSSFIVRKLPLVFAMVWFFMVTFSICIIACIPEDVPLWVRGWQFKIIEVTILAIIPNTTTVALLANVGKELKRMNNQSATITNDGEERKAAVYLIIVFTMEMVVFLLNVVCIIIFYYSGSVVLGKIWNIAIKGPHTIANTVIYGWRTRSYKQHVRKLFGCKPSQIANTGV